VKLRYTLRGAAELDKVLVYIEERSPQGARHVKARIQAIINLLLQYPHAGQLTSNRRLRRVVAFPYPYLIFYHATEDELVIHGVRHSARRPSSMPE
jgi:plasmid stabilization system protein ParE